MAIRSRELVPDVEIQTRNGPMAIVSREQMGGAVSDAVAMLDVAGGMFSVLTVRAPTGFPNEMVTVGGSVTWQDRTDAKPQAERAAEAQANGEVHPAQTTLNEQLADERHELEDVEAEVAGDIGDGLDDPAEAEDVSAIPENLR